MKEVTFTVLADNVLPFVVVGVDPPIVISNSVIFGDIPVTEATVYTDPLLLYEPIPGLVLPLIVIVSPTASFIPFSAST